MTTMRRRTARHRRVLIAFTVAALGLTIWPAGPASAHVTVEPETLPGGGNSAVLSFRVPNERTDSATTGLKVQFPRDHPLISATVKNKPGWTVSIKRMAIDKPVLLEGQPVDQAIDEIEWKGGNVPVGQFDDFEVNVGPVPDEPATLVFPAIQTYDKGDPVSWIDKPATDGRPLGHPAPTLHITAAGAGATTPPDAGSGPPAAAAPATPASDGANGVAIVLAALALAVAIAALALTLLTGRRPAASASTEPAD
jgi:uncharacterized protein YcnI